MPHDKTHYESWLKHLERREVELMQLLILIDELLVNAREQILQLKELSEEVDDFYLGNSLLQEIHYTRIQAEYRDELEEVRLDRSHAAFMISLLNRPGHDI